MTLEIKCVCGGSDIEHAFDSKWKCNGCGRLYDSEALYQLADKAREKE